MSPPRDENNLHPVVKPVEFALVVQLENPRYCDGCPCSTWTGYHHFGQAICLANRGKPTYVLLEPSSGAEEPRGEFNDDEGRYGWVWKRLRPDACKREDVNTI